MAQIPAIVFRAAALVVLASFAFTATGCGPLLRARSFKQSQEYFLTTPIESHEPQNGARASWHLINDPRNAAPYLAERLNSEDMAEAGTAIILLQAVAGERYQKELVEAIDSHDWSNAPGHVAEYVDLVDSDVRRGVKGVMED